MMTDLRNEQREYHEMQLLMLWKIFAATVVVVALRFVNLKLKDVHLIYLNDLVEDVCHLLSLNFLEFVQVDDEFVSFPSVRVMNYYLSMFYHRD